jgi:general secretion pathway protein N
VIGLPRKRTNPRPWSPTLTGWGESTFAEQAWVAARHAARRWAIFGAVLGVLGGLIAFAPAAWLAGAIASATDGRVLLADARGTVWNGSAAMTLTGGPDSRDASMLPGRMQWSVVPRGLAFDIRATHACCLNGTVTLRLRPGFGRFETSLVSPTDWIGQWPGALLSGLGTPWNTLQLGGAVRLSSPGFRLDWVQGRWRLEGDLHVEMLDASSRLSTLDTLGSYRLSVSGADDAGGTPRIELETLEGALQLTGSGTVTPGGVRFRGEASATEEDQAALNNLLNIIGRRDGARSIISIG